MPAKNARSDGAKRLETAEKEARRHQADSVELESAGAIITAYQTMHYRVSFRSYLMAEPIDDISDSDALRLIEAEHNPAMFASVLDEIRNNPTAVKLRAMRTADREAAAAIVEASRQRLAAAAGVLV